MKDQGMNTLVTQIVEQLYKSGISQASMVGQIGKARVGKIVEIAKVFFHAGDKIDDTKAKMRASIDQILSQESIQLELPFDKQEVAPASSVVTFPAPVAVPEPAPVAAVVVAPKKEKKPRNPSTIPVDHKSQAIRYRLLRFLATQKDITPFSREEIRQAIMVGDVLDGLRQVSHALKNLVDGGLAVKSGTESDPRYTFNFQMVADLDMCQEQMSYHGSAAIMNVLAQSLQPLQASTISIAINKTWTGRLERRPIRSEVEAILEDMTMGVLVGQDMRVDKKGNKCFVHYLAPSGAYYLFKGLCN